ncbi:hypothetical protein FJ251_02810 [bacterium]|nr:hypothetical protein [bacterium]
MRLRSLMILLGILALAAPAAAIPISNLHLNNANGVPNLLGQVVTVSGVITSPDSIYSTYNYEVYVQDPTGGVNLWVSAGAATYEAELGDSITVTATVANYNGLVELSTPSFVQVFHGAGYAVPAPLTITCAQLNSTFQVDHSEPNEGRLIRMDGLNIVSGAWPTSPIGSNSSIYVTDGTATALLFIDKDTAVNGSPNPGANFSAIGILKQYDTTSPYTSGYEIVPRFLSDIIPTQPGPPISGPARVIDLASTAATLYFETATPGSSEIEYGLTESYGLTAGDAGASELTHTVPLAGLTPNTIYHFRAKSSDAEGTRYGQDQLLATASDQPGELHVYMSFTADESYADTGNEVPESQNLSAILTQLINGADSSVDAALYSFSLTNVRDALVAAHQRGCLVRIIIEADNSAEYAIYCASFGIPYITSTYGGNHSAADGYGIMHNKYVVIDGRDADKYNDRVWTGSANMSSAGSDDVNNGLDIRDYGLAQAYLMDFNEMWGSGTQTPNAALARFGSRKRDDSPHEFRINGLRVEQYMSPSDAVEDQLERTVATADYSVYFAILSFTNYNLSDAMYDRRAALNGALEIRGVFDESLGACGTGSVYYEMAGDACTPYAWDIPADVWIDTPLPSSRLLHHKYMIVDVNNLGADPLVATGSHNYSFAADSRNDENTVIIHDQGAANMFLQEFAERYHESGGTGVLGTAVGVPDGTVPGSGLLAGLASFPNPFNPFTSIAFTMRADAAVSLEIYDAAGRLQRRLFADRQLAAGYHVIGWDGADESGRQLPSGVYFARLAALDAAGRLEAASHKLLCVQ